MNEILSGEMLFAPSKSRYELERDNALQEIKSFGETHLQQNALHEKVKGKFASRHTWENVWGGHLRQKAALKELAKVINPKQIVDRSRIPGLIEDYDLIISLGGDNHFQYCGQELVWHMQKNGSNEKYITGVVLDPKLSAGGLLNYDMKGFLSGLEDLTSGNYELEKWTTLEAEVNDGRKILKPYNAVSEMLIGEMDRSMMSRTIVFEEGKAENPLLPEKSSGILAAVGAGSEKGAWYSNVKSCYSDEHPIFDRTNPEARLLTTEHSSKAEYTLRKGEKLVLESYNDDAGIIRPDSHREHGVPFRSGSLAKLWISDYSLPVIRPLFEQKGER